MTDITRRRGDTYADVFIIKSTVTKRPIDITDCTFLLTVDPEKNPVDATNNLYQLTGTILDAPNGKVEFAPTAGEADLLGNYYYDVQMTDAAGRKRTVIVAKYKYEQDITKA